MFALNLSQGSSSSDGEETWPRNRSLRQFFYSYRTRRPGETLNSPTSITRNLNEGSPMRDRTVSETSKSDQSCDKLPIVVKSRTPIIRNLNEASPMRTCTVGETSKWYQNRFKMPIAVKSRTPIIRNLNEGSPMRNCTVDETSKWYQNRYKMPIAVKSRTSIIRNLNEGSSMRDCTVGETSKSDQNRDKTPIAVKSRTSITRHLNEGSPMRDRTVGETSRSNQNRDKTPIALKSRSSITSNLNEGSPMRDRTVGETSRSNQNRDKTPIYVKFPTAITRSLNEGSPTRDCKIGGTWRSDKNRDKMPIVEKVESGEDDDDWMCRDDEYDSDDLSLEIAKKSKWLKDFFGWMDSLNKDQIDDPTLMIHCPVCKGGARAVSWYGGFKDLLKHAKTVRSRRIRLHWRFTEILDGEMRDRRERSLVSNKEELMMEWKGLGEDVEDPHMIVWPPMVIVQNTRSRRGEDGKWAGIEKLELLNCFKDYNISEVKSSYGPTGHCGVSLLIFPSSALGYLEAEFVHQKFIKEGRGKNEWENQRRRHKHSGGDILLYGYMATEGDMDLFYKHAKGKKHEFEMKSYKMMVVDPFKKMEDNDQKLIQLEKKVDMVTEENKILTETRDVIRQKLRLRELEIETIRRRASEEFEEYKLEIASLDNHYADTIKEMAVATSVT